MLFSFSPPGPRLSLLKGAALWQRLRVFLEYKGVFIISIACTGLQRPSSSAQQRRAAVEGHRPRLGSRSAGRQVLFRPAF